MSWVMLVVGSMKVYTKIQKDQDTKMDEVFFLFQTSIVKLSLWTAVNNRGSIVSRPGKPGGGLAESFSSTVWGAEIKQIIINIHVRRKTSEIDNERMEECRCTLVLHVYTVICGKAIDDVQVLPECFLVLLGAQHWSHLRSALADAGNIVLTEKQVVGGHLTSDGKSFLFGNADNGNLQQKE